MRPLIDLQFAGARAIDPRVTFTRASSGVVLQQSGLLRTLPAGAPRLECVDGSSLGLLLEAGQTNLALYSEDASNAAWVKTGTTVSANATTAPDGTATADKLVEDSATSSHIDHQVVSATVYQAWTYSRYFKAAGRATVQLALCDDSATSNHITGFFDLSGSGTARAASSGGYGYDPTAEIQALAEGWYRCSISGVPSTSGTALRAITFLITGTVTGTYAGDGSSGVYVWGAQLEAAHFATSYVKTTSGSVTRATDFASILLANFGLVSTTAGTLLVAGRAPSDGDGSGQILATIDDGTGSANFNTLYRDPVTRRLAAGIYTSSVYQASSSLNVLADSTDFAIALAYATNDVAAAQDGALVLQDTSATICPTLTRIALSNNTASNAWGGTIARVAFWPTRLSNTTLQALTA